MLLSRWMRMKIKREIEANHEGTKTLRKCKELLDIGN